jgi:hypothetical protein
MLHNVDYHAISLWSACRLLFSGSFGRDDEGGRSMAPDVVVRRFNPTLSESRCTDAPSCTAPKRWTLARYTQVTRDGTVEHQDHEAFWFSTGCDEHRDSQLADLAHRIGRDPEVEQR